MPRVPSFQIGPRTYEFYISDSVPTPLKEGALWSDTLNDLLMFCTSLSPLTWVSVGLMGGVAAHAIDGPAHTGTLDHGATGDLGADDHTQYLKEKASGGTAAETPTHDHSGAAQAGTVDHGVLTGLGDDDHAQYLKEKASGGTAAETPAHDHSGAAEAGTVSHASLTGVTPDQHHTENHASRHQDSGADEISVTGLSGLLADAQKVTVRKNTGADVGTRKRLNLIEGTNITLTVTDDAVGDEIDITITSSGSGGSGNTGTATLNFGAFPGSTTASVAVTGQAAIVTGSIVQAWLRPVDGADHLLDDYIIDGPEVYAANIVAGTGFTIYGKAARDEVRLDPEVIARGKQPLTKNIPRAFGSWTVAWRWS